ncbi:DMT family transporter [Marinitenerispora sediminis]|uniref:QacE family quaternary ammonium compound efflux SMR transporter n=1 Tax=Marinitenerispora sediminis TaxID=1931232 RepID=A0A368T452_9ACTN|nr:multidrug efflux SMR transporter [Marinitenerispora sediminis]RCV55871.1 QacE family quaternary ammonium compound efflux SMR transporter [Marinitenerispora sediminis]RCV57334.1 QacE family quaternary ammonium compound efflux SMR transporter [Marinitenerispora sediminis]RCV59421.1 QacE family quaternary ammonium compound efflux SMR transporter [Marinitenerispora sediminis]
MAWLLVVVAGMLETVFAVALKLSAGFTRFWPTVTFAAAAVASFTLLSISLRTLPVGSAYAVWTGIGAAGTAVFGMMFLGDPVQVLRVVSIVLIVAGVVGLRLAGGGH